MRTARLQAADIIHRAASEIMSLPADADDTFPDEFHQEVCQSLFNIEAMLDTDLAIARPGLEVLARAFHDLTSDVEMLGGEEPWKLQVRGGGCYMTPWGVLVTRFLPAASDGSYRVQISGRVDSA